MKLLEYQANEIFAKADIPMAKGYVVVDPGQIKPFDLPVVVKAQVLTGGRGKAGGVKMAKSLDEARQIASDILGMDIKGHLVESLFIQDAAELLEQYYLGITIDREKKRPVLIFCEQGGIDIESIAEKTLKITLDPIDFDMEWVRRKISVRCDRSDELAEIARKLFQVFKSCDAILCEINPLCMTDAGLMGVDAKMEIDDNSMYRQPEIRGFDIPNQKTELEQRAQDMGLSYVELDGNIGVIGCGAGLVMASLDALEQYGGRPANFLDVGGGASEELVERSLEIALSKKGVKSLFINMFAGITRCDDVANAIKTKRPPIPITVRLMGTLEKEGKKILKDAGIEVFDSMEDAAKKAVEMSR